MLKETIKYARKDSKTGKGINSGYVVGGGDFYFELESDLIAHLRNSDFETAEGEKANNFSDSDLLEWAYNDEIYYFTEWEDENDFQFEEVNGVLTEIEI